MSYPPYVAHGTQGGYRRHLRSDGSDPDWPPSPCGPCNRANNEAVAKVRARARERAGLPPPRRKRKFARGG